jgi:hypothetical protein
LGGANIEVTEGQAKAAWALYIELSTRIFSQELKKGEGSIREALTSFYSIFETTRNVLKEAGPDAADGPESVGPIAINILNEGIRPFLVKWHTSLTRFENSEKMRLQKEMGLDVQIVIEEAKWDDYNNFYKELETFQKDIKSYLHVLAEISGIN